MRSSASSWREAAAWALAAILVVVAGYLTWNRGPAQTSAALRLSIPLEATVTLSGLSIALAPDGHAIAIQAPWNSRDTRLHLRRLDTARTVALPGTEGGRTPFWSPDSRAIGFVADGQLKRFDIDSSTVRVLCPAPQLFVGGAWGGNGNILFGGAVGALTRVSAAGGAAVPGTTDEAGGEISQSRPVFLPDGNRFTYLSRRSDGSIHTILGRLDANTRAEFGDEGLRVVWAGSDWVVYRRGEALYAQRVDYDAAGLLGEPTLITTELDSNTWTGNREAVAANGVVAFIEHADRRRQFTWYARDGRPEKPIGPTGEFTTFDLSADGRRVIAALRSGGSSNLWTIDTGTGAAARMTVGDVVDVDPRWSADGRSVLFGSLRDPARSPFRVMVSGNPPTLAWKFDGRMFALDDWSSDGRWVVHHDSSVPVLQVRLVDPVTRPGETRDQVVVAARALAGTVDQGQMSPDGRWIAYNSNESGRHEVVVVPFPPTGDRFQVSRSGGVQPMWRADGRELYFLALDGTLMVAPIAGGSTLGAGEPTSLFKTQVLAAASDIEQYAPAANGTRFLILDFAGEKKAPAVQVVTDWRALVDRPAR